MFLEQIKTNALEGLNDTIAVGGRKQIPNIRVGGSFAHDVMHGMSGKNEGRLEEHDLPILYSVDKDCHHGTHETC